MGKARRTTAAPVYRRGRVAVRGARKVRERIERRDLGSAERGDSLTLDRGCINEPSEHDRKRRRPQENHDCTADDSEIMR